MPTLKPRTITGYTPKGYAVECDILLEEGEKFCPQIGQIEQMLARAGLLPNPPRNNYKKRSTNGERTFTVAGYVLHCSVVRPDEQGAFSIWLFAAGEKMKYKIVEVRQGDFSKLPFDVNLEAKKWKGRRAPEKPFAEFNGYFNTVKPFKAVVKTTEANGQKVRTLAKVMA